MRRDLRSYKRSKNIRKLESALRAKDEALDSFETNVNEKENYQPSNPEFDHNDSISEDGIERFREDFQKIKEQVQIIADHLGIDTGTPLTHEEFDLEPKEEVEYFDIEPEFLEDEERDILEDIVEDAGVDTDDEELILNKSRLSAADTRFLRAMTAKTRRMLSSKNTRSLRSSRSSRSSQSRNSKSFKAMVRENIKNLL